MSNDRVTPDQKLALQRAATGLLAGLALYALFQIKTPATVIAPLILACVFAPLMLVQGWRAIAPRLLAGWVGVATLVILGLGLYDKLRITPGSITDDVEATVAAPLLWMAIAVSLFIGQALVTAASLSGRRIAPYETYFDLAWTQGVQVAATFAFTVVLWLSLFLGAQLFELINIKVLDDLIHERWFSFPVTTLAVALALHVTDVRPGIIRGIRSLVHTLLTWLLPLMTVLAVGFIATLPFTGLSPLWSTRFATQLLLTVAAALVILINVAYQGGSQEETLPRADAAGRARRHRSQPARESVWLDGRSRDRRERDRDRCMLRNRLRLGGDRHAARARRCMDGAAADDERRHVLRRARRSVRAIHAARRSGADRRGQSTRPTAERSRSP